MKNIKRIIESVERYEQTEENDRLELIAFLRTENSKVGPHALAQRVGLKTATLSQYLNPKTNISKRVLAKIAKNLV